MPYKSEKQRRYMHAKHPKIAREWDEKYGGKVSKREGSPSARVSRSKYLSPEQHKSLSQQRKSAENYQLAGAGTYAGTLLGGADYAMRSGPRAISRGEKSRVKFIQRTEQPKNAKRNRKGVWDVTSDKTKRHSRRYGQAKRAAFLTRNANRIGATALGAGMVGGTALMGVGGRKWEKTVNQERKFKRENKAAGRVYKSVSKRERPSALKENQKLKRAKQISVGTSLTGSALGLGALGSLGAAAASKNPRVINAHRYSKFTRPETSEKLKNRAAVLTTTGAGVGGFGGLNFAAVQAREARQLDDKIKSLQRRNVRKNMDIGMDFGLSSVHQGERVEIVKARDGMNISEHQRRARDSRRTARRAGNVAGLGGTAIATAAALGSRKGVNVADEAVSAYRTIKGGAGIYRAGVKTSVSGGAMKPLGRGMRKTGRRMITTTPQILPYGTAVLAGSTGMAGGLGTAAGARVNEKRHDRAISDLRRRRVKKAYDPERSRDRRLSAYQTAAGAAGGATLVGAGLQGRKALGQKPGDVVTQVVRDPKSKKVVGYTKERFHQGTGLRSKNQKLYAKGVKGGFKAAGIGAAGVGALVGADRIGQYRKRRGSSYRPRVNFD